MTTTQSNVYQGILLLAGVCNGASSWDGQGFGKFDAEMGHSFARRIQQAGYLTEKQFTCAKRLCHKYRKQLLRAGMDLDQIQAEAWTMPEGVTVRSRPETRMIKCEVRVFHRETEKAYMVDFLATDTGRMFRKWVPKSQVRNLVEHQGHPFEFELPEFIVYERR